MNTDTIDKTTDTTTKTFLARAQTFSNVICEEADGTGLNSHWTIDDNGEGEEITAETPDQALLLARNHYEQEYPMYFDGDGGVCVTIHDAESDEGGGYGCGLVCWKSDTFQFLEAAHAVAGVSDPVELADLSEAISKLEAVLTKIRQA